jgi:5-methyltetrahydrofolate--homocysteine methyltransferase
VAGKKVLVLGDIGPIGRMMIPLGDLSIQEATISFAEQASALASGGVDAIFIETMSDINEAIAAIHGAKQATDLPILVSMSFDTHGRTMMGIRPEDEALDPALNLGDIEVHQESGLHENHEGCPAL